MVNAIGRSGSMQGRIAAVMSNQEGRRGLIDTRERSMHCDNHWSLFLSIDISVSADSMVGLQALYQMRSICFVCSSIHTSRFGFH